MIRAEKINHLSAKPIKHCINHVHIVQKALLGTCLGIFKARDSLVNRFKDGFDAYPVPEMRDEELLFGGSMDVFDLIDWLD